MNMLKMGCCGVLGLFSHHRRLLKSSVTVRANDEDEKADAGDNTVATNQPMADVSRVRVS